MPVVGNPRTLSQRPGEAQQHQVDETEENYSGRSTNHFHGSGPQDHPKGTIKAASLTPKDNDPARTDNSSEVVQPLAVTPKTAYSPQLTVTVARPLVEPKCTETWLVRENIRMKQGSSCKGPSSVKEEGYMYQRVQKGELHEHCVVKSGCFSVESMAKRSATFINYCKKCVKITEVPKTLIQER